MACAEKNWLAEPTISLQISQYIAGIRADDDAALRNANFMAPFAAINAAPDVEIIDCVLHIVFRTD